VTGSNAPAVAAIDDSTGESPSCRDRRVERVTLLFSDIEAQRADARRRRYGWKTGETIACEAVLIDPPRASVRWRMTGSSEEMTVDVSGATLLSFDDDGRIEEFWLYFHDPLA
jgi:hypothetical protein